MEFKVRETRHVEYEVESGLTADNETEAVALFTEKSPTSPDEVDRSMAGGISRLTSVEVHLIDEKGRLVATKNIRIWQK